MGKYNFYELLGVSVFEFFPLAMLEFRCFRLNFSFADAGVSAHCLCTVGWSSRWTKIDRRLRRRVGSSVAVKMISQPLSPTHPVLGR